MRLAQGLSYLQEAHYIRKRPWESSLASLTLPIVQSLPFSQVVGTKRAVHLQHVVPIRVCDRRLKLRPKGNTRSEQNALQHYLLREK